MTNLKLIEQLQRHPMDLEVCIDFAMVAEIRDANGFLDVDDNGYSDVVGVIVDQPERPDGERNAIVLTLGLESDG